MFDITWSTFPGLNYSLECETDMDFSGTTVLGPIEADDFTESATIQLDNGGRDFVRARRN